MIIHPPHSAARCLLLCLPFERTLGQVLHAGQLDGVDSVTDVTIDTSRLREKHTMHLYATATITLTCTFTISWGSGSAVASTLLVLGNLLVRILDCRHGQKYNRTIERSDAPVKNSTERPCCEQLVPKSSSYEDVKNSLQKSSCIHDHIAGIYPITNKWFAVVSM
jgi:hypothetical protein